MSKRKPAVSSARALEHIVSRYTAQELADIQCDDGGQPWGALFKAIKAEMQVADGDEFVVSEEAAFRVGIELGRRLAGVR